MEQQCPLTPRHWQIAVGQELAKSLERVLRHSGMHCQFVIVTRPDQDPFQLKVFKLDRYGDYLYQGAKETGFEVFRVEIKFPNYFTLNCFDKNGKQKKGSPWYSRTPMSLIIEAEDVLLCILSNYWTFKVT